jgi:fatty acid CoA ligase FadD36
VALLAGLTAGRGGDGPGSAVTVAGRSLTRAELYGAATALAAEIAGAPAVAVDATPTLATVVAVVAGLVAGVPVVPLPPDSGPAELSHLVRDSGAALLLATRDDPVERDRLAGLVGLPTLAVDPHRTRGSATPWSGAAASDPDSPAMVLYTSGTTGPPKGAMISRAAVVAEIEALASAWAWTADDVLVHGLPLFHVHGLVLGVLGPLHLGCGLRHTGRPTPAAYAAAAAAGGTVFFGVPTVWSRICADPAAARALRRARLLVSGSAALPVPAFDRIAALTGHRPVERYGMTETLITVSARAGGERRPGQVGLRLDGVRTRLVAEDGGTVAEDGESLGELLVRGPTLLLGYRGPGGVPVPAVDADGWFHTGDVATIGPDGWHRIVGRASMDIIKSGGYKIGAGEVEGALLAHPGVREAAVVGRPDDDLGERVTAFVVADGVTGPELVRFVAGTLSAHKRPREVRLVAELPRNAMGKVQKHRLG